MYDRYLLMPREMSWLSPKRRRTTGNVATLANATTTTPNNGQPQEDGESEPSSSPRVRSPKSSSSLSRVPMTPKSDPPALPPLRPAFQQTASSTVMPGSGEEGNLFYAYARRADDARSRFLLTFASASIANEWWALLQTHFPECTRPGPQLFSFKSDDLLGKAWKHAAFAHLKSKWMYIQFNDAGNVGGAAQGIIPVQDAQGHLLGGSAGSGSDSQLGQVRKEARSVRNELGTLESHFERMMEAVEKNSEQIAALAEDRKGNDQALVQAVKENGASTNGHVDMSDLSTHLGRISDLLERNQEHVEAVSKRQQTSEQKLREALEETKAQKRADYLDMSQLSTHLDRIQKLMERTAHERKDSAKDLRNQTPNIDISPLTERLEKVLEAVEHNSSLVKEMLDSGAKDRESQHKQAPLTVDLTPMTDHLQRIHGAIEQQSSHMQALVGFAGGDTGEEGADDDKEAGLRRVLSPVPQVAASLAPLSEHLEQIFTAIEEGNAQVKSLVAETTKNGDKQSSVDFKPLVEKMDELVRAQEEAVESSSQKEIDFEPVVERLDKLLEAQKEAASYRPEGLNLAPLEKKLDELVRAQTDAAGSQREVSFDPVVERLDALLEAQKEAKNDQPEALDIAPLTSRLDDLLKVTKLSSPAKQQQLDLRPLSTRLEKLLEAHRMAHDLDLSPLSQRLDDLLDAQHSASERQQDVDAQLAVRFDKLVDGQQKAVERGPFDISLLSQRIDEILSVHRAAASAALIDKLDELKQVQERAAEKDGVDLGPLAVHLKSIRAATERNEKRVASLLEAQQAGNRSATEILGPLGKSMDGLSKASERNAEMIGSLLDAQREGNEALRSSTDLVSLGEHLDEIRMATDKNGKHLAGLIEAGNKVKQPTTDLAPLIEHLEVIRRSSESRDVEKQQADKHLQAIRSATTETGQHMAQLLNLHATSSNQPAPPVDLTPLLNSLEALRTSTEANSAQLTESLRSQSPKPPPTDLAPLLESLESLRTTTEENGAQLTGLLHSRPPSQKALTPTTQQVDFSPLTDRLTRIHTSLEQQAARSESPGLGDTKFIMSALTSHLSKIQAVTEANAVAVRAMREKQDKGGERMHMAMAEANDQLRGIKEAHAASQKGMQTAVAATSVTVRALAKQTSEFGKEISKHTTELSRQTTDLVKQSAELSKQSVAESKVGAEQRKKEKKDSDALAGKRDGQVDVVIKAQGEVLESVRALAQAIKMEKKECGHVVVPPPRKTGRKVVGFVYEGGAAAGGGSGGGKGKV